MSLKIWIDGSLVDKADAKVSVYDHGLLYGDGVFEGIRVYGGRVFEEEAHLQRLWDSAKSIRLEIPYSRQQLSEVMYECIEANGLVDAYIRLVVTRGFGDLGLDPRRCKRASVFCIADKIALYPPEFYESGLPIITASVIKNHPNATPPRIKSLNYLNSILAKIEAVDAGCMEAVLLNHLGYVAECTADNIFIVKNGVVMTPPTEAGILEGITRDVVMRLCRREGIECIEKNLVRFDLYSADECFMTGTAAEVIGVTSIDKRQVGDGTPGPVTRRLKAAFAEFVRTQDQPPPSAIETGAGALAGH
jgi:branched-chain amino acid aminotransferase